MTKKKKSQSRYSNLDRHQRQGQLLQAPFNKVSNLKKSSWVNECIPNVLWACILVTFLDRKVALNLFRSVVINTRKHIANYKEMLVTHNALSQLSEQDFDAMFKLVFDNEQAKKTLSALLLIDCLPDKHHWIRHLPSPEEKDASILYYAVGTCFDHQSQESTDIRWLKVMHLICTERLFYPPEMAERMEEFRVYPDKGDMRSVRPSIRAMEMAYRALEEGTEGNIKLSQPHQELFWKEMLRKTGCIFAARKELPDLPNPEIRMAIFDVLKDAALHFDTILDNTGVDARLDSSFGLVMYACTMALNSAMSHSHTMVEGRLILRTIMECFVTLHFLKYKDDSTIWHQYRTYGSSQAKLAFLKNVDLEQTPEFLDIKLIENLATEDMWLEYQDINLGVWANKNLRALATECGVKEVYDKYYDWSSGYAHANWICVRDTVFAMCTNPLHRFHRFPITPRMDMPSILPDACKLINRMLDDLNALYPAFKPRLKSYTLQEAYAEKAQDVKENAG